MDRKCSIRFLEKYQGAMNKLDDVALGNPIRSMHRPEVAVAASIFDWCIDPFRCYLQQRLNHKKVEGTVRPVAQFLQGVEKSGVLSLSAITPQIICEEFERATDKYTYTHAMRHFLKYAAEKLLIPYDYSYFVPSVRHHHTVPSVYTKRAG